MSVQLNSDKKIIVGGGILTIIIIGAISIFLSKSLNTTNTNISEDQIVAKTGLHWHPTLEIYIQGEKQEIPANVGIGAIHQEMHTHEDNKEGIIHMEMQGLVTKDETRLGRFFQIWGKKFNSGQIFEFKNSTEAAVKMSVNGRQNSDFENYLMRDGDKIEVRYE